MNVKWLYSQLSCKQPPLVHDEVAAYKENQPNNPKTESIN